MDGNQDPSCLCRVLFRISSRGSLESTSGNSTQRGDVDDLHDDRGNDRDRDCKRFENSGIVELTSGLGCAGPQNVDERPAVGQSGQFLVVTS